MRRLLATVLLLAGACAAPRADAHDTWLAPQAPGAGDAHWTLDLTTGHGFPALAEAPAVQRVLRADAIGPAGALPLLPRAARADALPFRALVDRSPLLVAVVALRPATTVLDADAVARYLGEELGVWPALRDRHRRLGRWRERYTKNAKAVLRIDAAGHAPGADGLATRPHGLPYELVPRTDPTRRAPGDALTVCAFADGAPVREPFVPLRIGLVEADGSASWQVADAEGCASVRPVALDGYLLRSVLIRPLDSPLADWDSHFATLTVGRASERPSTPAEESSP